MSGPRNNSNGVPVSLFPFLAVLLCTMGALVMLLVAMTHIARQQAQAAEAEPVVEAPEDTAEADKRREDYEVVQAKLEQLVGKRDEVDEALQAEQLRLSQIEGHINRLMDRLASLRAAVAELEAADARRQDDQAQAERNLEQLQELIEETKQEIAELKAEQEGKNRSYAIVPYKGRNGTQRRPIYIECQSDQVVLQPEGVVLQPDDFRRPLGVGNPLAAALRATREHHARENPNAGYDPDAEPYPLILVRPGGIQRYYDVREAIRSWDSDFGYELVGGDWDLAFPPPNPVLHNAQSVAIDQARLRRTILARAAPSAYGGSGFGGYDSGSPGSGGDQPYDGRTLGPPNGGADSRGGGQSLAGGQGGRDTGGVFDGEASGESADSDQVARAGSVAPEGASSDNSGKLTPSAGAGAEDAEAPNGSSASPGQAMAGMSPGQASASGQQSGANGGSGSGDESPSSSMSGSNTMSASMTPPVARERGANWAVERGAPTDIAIRRPVQVVVEANRLVILNSRSGRASARSTTPVDGSTRAAIDPFVESVQREVRSWGIAGQGLYWRPVLNLRVAPDGVSRAQDLVHLLERSGIDVNFQRTAAAPQGGTDGAR